jgi:DNA primase
MHASDFPRKFYFPDVSQIPSETTQRILAATDLVELIGSYIEVKRIARFYAALCPFHDGEWPSFAINPADKFFSCFGCGKKGDAIAFVSEIEQIAYHVALGKLAARAGIEIPKS